LVEVKSGEVFSKSPSDWRWAFRTVKQTLSNLNQEKLMSVVIFTNQMGIQVGKTSKEQLLAKLIKIQEALEIPVTVFASTNLDHNRKPSPLMWTKFEQALLEEHSLRINYQESFYCGDSAGRAINPQTRKPDFSDSDYKFASNSGLQFKVPEEVFAPSRIVKFKYDLLGNYKAYLQFQMKNFRNAENLT